MLRSLLKQSIGMMIGAALVLVVMQFTASVRASTTQVASATVIQEALASAPMLSYQGRLLDPATGQPKPDGAYTMQFKIYDVAAAGAPLWSENKNVNTNKGLFATLLGDTTALDTSIFDGRSLFLAISISGDPEITPRQPIAHNAYAIFAMNADKVDGYDANAFFRGSLGVQIADTLAPNAQVTYTSWGWDRQSFVEWWAMPSTEGGKLSTSVEREIEPCCGQGQGKVRYWITVKNTSSVTTNFELKRTIFVQ